MAFGEDFGRALGKLGLPLTILAFLAPGKQVSKEITDYVRTLREEGISVNVVEVNLTAEEAKWWDQVNRDVDKYVAELEEAHDRAKHSKLHFGAACPLTAS